MKCVSLGGFFSLALATLAADAAQSGKRDVPLPEVRLSVPRGFYEAPFTLKLEAPVDASLIRFTTDFSEPTLQNGRDYAGPLNITNTTILRAAAFKASK